MDHQQTCVICKNEATVSSIWKRYNQCTCMSKVCARVFNNLPDDIINQFNMQRDDRDRYIDRGKYYSKVGDEEYIDLEVDLNRYRFDKRFYEAAGHEWVNETLQNIEFWEDYSEWIAQNCEVSSGIGSYKQLGQESKYSYAQVEVITSEEIYPKINQSIIDRAINELLILERTKSMTDEVKRICKRNNINTFFCNRSPAYNGLRIPKTYI